MPIRTTTDTNVITYYYDQAVYDMWRHSLEISCTHVEFSDIPENERIEFLSEMVRDIERLEGKYRDEWGTPPKVKEIQELIRTHYFIDERLQDED